MYEIIQVQTSSNQNYINMHNIVKVFMISKIVTSNFPETLHPAYKFMQQQKNETCLYTRHWSSSQTGLLHISHPWSHWFSLTYSYKSF